MNRRFGWIAFPLISVAFLVPTLRADDKTQAEAVVKPTEKPFLWMIEGKGLKKPSFILGTIHLPDAKATTLPTVVSEAMRVSDSLFTEIPMDMQTMMMMVPKMAMSDGKTLKDVLPAKLHAELAEYLKTKGIDIEPYERMKTWVMTMQLSLLDRQKELATSMPLDMQLFMKAQGDGKDVGGVETVDEQLSIFESMSEADTVTMLEQTLKTIKEWEAKNPKRSMADAMVEMYYAGEGDKLMEFAFSYMDRNDPLQKKFYEKLVTERDARMAQRVAKIIRDNKEQGHFFAVGALHLLTRGDGVIDRLARDGFKMTRMTPADAERVGKLAPVKDDKIPPMPKDEKKKP